MLKTALDISRAVFASSNFLPESDYRFDPQTFRFFQKIVKIIPGTPQQKMNFIVQASDTVVAMKRLLDLSLWWDVKIGKIFDFTTLACKL